MCLIRRCACEWEVVGSKKLPSMDCVMNHSKRSVSRRRMHPSPWYARSYVAPCVVGESGFGELCYPKCTIRRFADRMRYSPTPSERHFNSILNSLNRGVLRGQFIRQYPVSGEYIVDVFFPRIRLAVEIDGSIHDEYLQCVRDDAKEKYCARIDITMLRFTNDEVWGDRVRLVERLRDGWRAALRRENRIIGKAYGEVEW